LFFVPQLAATIIWAYESSGLSSTLSLACEGARTRTKQARDNVEDKPEDEVFWFVIYVAP